MSHKLIEYCDMIIGAQLQCFRGIQEIDEKPFFTAQAISVCRIKLII